MLRNFCDGAITKYPQYNDLYRKEIILAKRYYDNNMNLFEMLEERKDNISKRYVIPFLLGFTNEVVEKEWEYRFVKEGSSGGIDVDCDFSSKGKELIQQYILDKYGEERVLHVGTFSRLGPASAAKDLLRIYKIDYTKSNEFTKLLDKSLDWEENIEYIRQNYPEQFKFYENNKTILDMVPHFINKIRQSGKHAGGIVITDEPYYKLIPIDRVGGEICSAFPESAQQQVLDELGVVKLDILGITIMDVIGDAIDSIEEKLYLIEEEGIKIIVPESYLDEEIIRSL